MEKSGLAVSKPEVLRMLEQEKEKAIIRDIRAALKRSQELRSDFLGLGDRLYREHPDVWAQVKDDWRDVWLPRIAVDIEVTSKLRRLGTITDPLILRSR